MGCQAMTPAVDLNGEVVGLGDGLGDLPPHTTALDWLREQGVTGSKEGCAEGECGACSILVARPGVETATEWTPINACLVPIAALDGQEIVTAEGLGRATELHPVQREMAVRGGSQCGYCTPGFICSMAGEYYRKGRMVERVGTGSRRARPADSCEHGPNGFDLHALSGNLCRCTGYRPIRDAAYALPRPAEGDPLAERRDAPPPAAVPTRIRGFARPADLAEAFDLVDEGATVVAGSTDWGVEVNLRGVRAPLVVAIDRLPELRSFHVGDDVIELGAALSLSEVERRLAGRIPLLDQMFPQFASRLIRNGATIGGNLGTGSPIGDTPPALLALEATVVLASRDGDREVPLADYFTGYRQSVRRPGELIRAIRLPLPLAGVTAFHKIAKRRFDDISSVALGFALDIEGGVVRRAAIGVGGVAATPIRAYATEEVLVGRQWSEDTVRHAAAVMATEGTPMSDHRASASYRSAMLGQALLRLYASTGSDRLDHPGEVSA
jgi:xanthine dehydrogenase small subunit